MIPSTGHAHGLEGGVPESVPALTVARICGSGAEAVAVGGDDWRRLVMTSSFTVWAVPSMQYPFAYTITEEPVGQGVQKYGPIDTHALPKGTIFTT